MAQAHRLIQVLAEIHEPLNVDSAEIGAILVADASDQVEWIRLPFAYRVNTGTLVSKSVTTPVAYTNMLTEGVTEGQWSSFGFTVNSNWVARSLLDRPYIIKAAYVATLSHNDVAAQDVFSTFAFNGVALTKFACCNTLAQNVPTIFGGTAMFKMEMGDTLELMVKVAVGNIAVSNPSFVFFGYPPNPV